MCNFYQHVVSFLVDRLPIPLPNLSPEGKEFFSSESLKSQLRIIPLPPWGKGLGIGGNVICDLRLLTGEVSHQSQVTSRISHIKELLISQIKFPGF